MRNAKPICLRPLTACSRWAFKRRRCSSCNTNPRTIKTTTHRLSNVRLPILSFILPTLVASPETARPRECSARDEGTTQQPAPSPVEGLPPIPISKRRERPDPWNAAFRPLQDRDQRKRWRVPSPGADGRSSGVNAAIPGGDSIRMRLSSLACRCLHIGNRRGFPSFRLRTVPGLVLSSAAATERPSQTSGCRSRLRRVRRNSV